MQGNATELANALVAIAEHVFHIPPFVPDTGLANNWRDLLTAWISGVDVTQIGADNMRVIEDAFIYRLTWAAEAIRMKRRADGGKSEYTEGSAAACLETGLPHSMMAMLVRAGLPSRVAARAVIEQTQPFFATLSDMNTWLSSNEIAALSDDQNWPTPETAVIWSAFRKDVLAAPIQRWSEQEWEFESKLPQWANPAHPARIHIDDKSGRVAVTSPDYREITGIKQGLSEPRPSLLRVDYASGRQTAIIKRAGRGRASWRSN